MEKRNNYRQNRSDLTKEITGAIASSFLLSLAIFACNDRAIALPPSIGEFSTDQLFASGGGGCGMTLWKPENSKGESYIFFNGLDASHRFGTSFDGGSMYMAIDGRMTKFRRIKAQGKDFYGQKTFQSFQSFDRKILVEVEVTLGKVGEIESVAIQQGIIRIKKIGEPAIEIPVLGDAGC